MRACCHAASFSPAPCASCKRAVYAAADISISFAADTLCLLMLTIRPPLMPDIISKAFTLSFFIDTLIAIFTPLRHAIRDFRFY